MAEETTLVLKNDIAELERVMNYVQDLSLRLSIPAETEYDINLALDEIITNIAKHAFPQGGEHEFSLQISVNDREFTARVEDDGVEFNPLNYPLPDLEAPLEKRKGGGLGIFLVRQIMTNIQYQRVGGKNQVILHKRIA